MKQTSLATIINKKIGMYVAGLILVGVVFSLFQLDRAKNTAFTQLTKLLQSQIVAKQASKEEVGIISSIAIAQNPQIIKALLTNNRELAIRELKYLVTSFKANTPFKNVKIHIHTKDVKSFVRAWKPTKFGDDLSSFRKTIVEVASSKKSISAIEVGRAGLVVRGISPIFDKNKNYIGSVEVIQGLNSVVKALQKENTKLIILMDEKYKRGNSLTTDSKIQNYYISQKTLDKKFKGFVAQVDLKKLSKDGYLFDSTHLFVSSPIRDFSKNIVGMYVIGKYMKDINESIDANTHLVYIMGVMTLLIVLLMMVLVNNILKSTLKTELKIFNDALDHFLGFISFKVNTYKPTEIKYHDELGQLLHRLNEIAKVEDGRLKSDMQVMGEITITTDKVEQGIYGCRIKAKTSNPMIQTLSITINKMIAAMDRDMTQLKNTLASYSNDDFRPAVSIDPSLRADMLSVMNSVNTLGDSLRANAKTNLTNGEILNTNAVSMSDSVSNLADKANQQAASLEETAAAVEEITSITRNNADNSI
ncbi:MAG TPA: methyl-accepting chemotaxis protein, partial [Arcobacter sp.]|nr:methyl-accepting chemotaxis protein [Arcobacter sp.]